MAQNIEAIDILSDGYITIRGNAGPPAHFPLISSLDYAPSFTAGFTASDPSTITLAAKTTQHIGITVTNTASVVHTGWSLGFYGTVTQSGGGVRGGAAGGYFELTLATTFTGSTSSIFAGMCLSINVNNTTGAIPTSGLWIETIATGQSLKADGSNTDMAMITLVTSGAQAKSSLAIEFGSERASKTVSTDSGGMFYNQTIQVKANGTLMYIPLSTAQGNYTTAYPIISSNVFGFASTAALDPNSTRSNHAFAYGWRGDANEVTATFENSADQNLEPIAINLDIAGLDPSGDSTVNVIYQNLTHDATNMPHIRLKQADWYMSIKKNVLDVYNMQLETSFGGATVTVGTEMACLGIVLDGSGGEVTCTAWRGINITMRGSGTPHNFAQGLFINAEVQIDAGVELNGSAMQVAIRCGTTSYANSPVHFAGFPEAGTTPVVSGADSSADVEGSIAIKVGAITKYLHYWPDAA